jgi:YD repeat-containing protein
MQSIDPEDNSTFYTYDNLGRTVQRIHPDAGTTKYAYDEAGNMTSLQTANLAEKDTVIKYLYNYNRISKIIYPFNPQNNVTYHYGEPGADKNRAGQVWLLEDATGSQEFEYGALGEVTKTIRTILVDEIKPKTYTTSFEYDSWNRITKMVYPDSEALSYTYNAAGNLNSFTGQKEGFSY